MYSRHVFIYLSWTESTISLTLLTLIKLLYLCLYTLEWMNEFNLWHCAFISLLYFFKLDACSSKEGYMSFKYTFFPFFHNLLLFHPKSAKEIKNDIFICQKTWLWLAYMFHTQYIVHKCSSNLMYDPSGKITSILLNVLHSAFFFTTKPFNLPIQATYKKTILSHNHI